MTGQRFCDRCGSVLPMDARLCPECGAALTATSAGGDDRPRDQATRRGAPLLRARVAPRTPSSSRYPARSSVATPWVIAWLVLLPPLGLVIVWTASTWSRRAKQYVTGIFVWPLAAWVFLRENRMSQVLLTAMVTLVWIVSIAAIVNMFASVGGSGALSTQRAAATPSGVSPTVAAFTPTARPSPPAARPPTDPLDQMTAVFAGSYARAEIQNLLDEVLRLYGEPVNDDSRSRAGSMLVALRREYGFPEMQILDYMRRSYVPGVNMSLAGMAALSVAALAAGDR